MTTNTVTYFNISQSVKKVAEKLILKSRIQDFIKLHINCQRILLLQFETRAANQPSCRLGFLSSFGKLFHQGLH